MSRKDDLLKKELKEETLVITLFLLMVGAVTIIATGNDIFDILNIGIVLAMTLKVIFPSLLRIYSK